MTPEVRAAAVAALAMSEGGPASADSIYDMLATTQLAWLLKRPERARALVAALLDVDAESVARHFHEAYERLAPSFGYETRKASAVPWADVPEPNRSLMVAVADEVLRALTKPDTRSEP